MENAVPGEAYEQETQRDIIGRNMGADGNDILGKFNPGLGAQEFTYRRFGEVCAQRIGPRVRNALHGQRDAHGGCVEAGDRTSEEPPKRRYFFATGPSAGTW